MLGVSNKSTYDLELSKGFNQSAERASLETSGMFSIQPFACVRSRQSFIDLVRYCTVRIPR